MDEAKTNGQIMNDRLFYECGSAWEKLNDEEKAATFALCERYKRFLNSCKTERETVREIVRRAEEKGFISLEQAVARGSEFKAGMKLYTVNKAKSVVLNDRGWEQFI